MITTKNKLKREADYVRTISAKIHLLPKSTNEKFVRKINEEYKRILNLFIEYYFKNWNNTIEIISENRKTKEIDRKVVKISDFKGNDSKSTTCQRLIENPEKLQAVIIQSISTKAHGIVASRMASYNLHNDEFKKRIGCIIDGKINYGTYVSKIAEYHEKLVEYRSSTSTNKELPFPPKLSCYHPHYKKNISDNELILRKEEWIKDPSKEIYHTWGISKNFDDIPYFNYNQINIGNYGPQTIIMKNKNIYIEFNPYGSGTYIKKKILIPVIMKEKFKEEFLTNLASSAGGLHSKNSTDKKEILALPSITINLDKNMVAFPITFENKSSFWEKIDPYKTKWVAIDPGMRTLMSYVTSDGYEGHFSHNGIKSLENFTEKLLKIKELIAVKQKQSKKYPDDKKIETILRDLWNCHDNLAKNRNDIVNAMVNEFYKRFENYEVFFYENNAMIKHGSKASGKFSKFRRKKLEVSMFDFLLKKIAAKAMELGKVAMAASSYYNSVQCFKCGHVEKRYKYQYKKIDGKLVKNENGEYIYNLDESGNKIPVLAEKNKDRNGEFKKYSYKKGQPIFSLDGNRPNGAEIFKCCNSECGHTEHSDIHSCRNIGKKGILFLTDYKKKKLTNKEN